MSTASFFGLSLWPPFDFATESPSPAVPFCFELQMSFWLATQLGTAVYPLKIPQKATSYPAMVYTVVGGDSILLLSGPALFYWSTIQFDSYSTFYADSANLDASLEALLAPYVGPMGTAQVVNAVRHPRRTGVDAPPASSDDGMFRTMSEWTFWYFKNPY